MQVCVCVHVCVLTSDLTFHCLELESQLVVRYPTWVLRTKPEHSRGAEQFLQTLNLYF